jgi:hypothetical protein
MDFDEFKLKGTNAYIKVVSATKQFHPKEDCSLCGQQPKESQRR